MIDAQKQVQRRCAFCGQRVTVGSRNHRTLSEPTAFARLERRAGGPPILHPVHARAGADVHVDHPTLAELEASRRAVPAAVHGHTPRSATGGSRGEG